MKTYEALHTTIDLAGLQDILEMKEVHATWMWAAELNAEERAEMEARMHGYAR